MSSIWTYFKKGIGEDANKAICCLCPASEGSRKVLRGKTTRDFSTTPLWNHLMKKHQDKYKELNKDGKRETKRQKLDAHIDSTVQCSVLDTMGKKQLTLPESLQQHKKWNYADPRSASIRKLICEVIALDCQPYAVVNRAGFRRIFQCLAPKFEMPNERTFSRELIPKLYGNIETKVRQKLKEAQYISFTTDIWTCSINNEAFISLSAHFICPKTFQQKLFTLATTHFPEAHTAINIADMVNGTLSKWEIKKQQLHIIMRDNAANIALATEMTELHGLGCFIHTLQLCINDSVFYQSSVKTIIINCRKIVTHFNMSPTGATKLKKIQENLKLPAHQLKQDVPTRWNSTYEMLERIHEQRAAVTAYGVEHDIPHIPAYEWAIVENIIRLLMPFNTFTKEASSDGETISCVITAVKTILKYLSKKQKDVGVLAMKEQLKCAIERRFMREKKIDQDKLYVIANILDPRYKLAFTGESDREKSKKWIIDEMVKIHNFKVNNSNIDCNEEELAADDPAVIESIPGTEEAKNLTAEVHDDLWKCYDYFQEGNSNIMNESDNEDNSANSQSVNDLQSPRNHKIKNNCKHELDMYLNLERLPRERKPLEWWAQNCTKFPLMVPIVLKYLSSPPSSVYSERIFSAAGRIYADNRANLNPENAEKLLFLMKNLVYFNYDYSDCEIE